MRNYSIRHSLQGELQDFLRDSGFVNCIYTSDLIRDLTVLLAAYREEDVPLFPSVYILASHDQLSLISPGTESVAVGTTKLEAITASLILKECAPLAVNGWSIFVVKYGHPSVFIYGLFRSLKHTVATSAEESMIQDIGASTVLVIRNCGHLIVELMNAKQETFTASLTTAEATSSHYKTHILKLAESIGAKLDSGMKEAFVPYLSRFLGDTLQRCHGTLCAVLLPPDNGTAPQDFSKSVWLKTPIQSAKLHSEARIQKSADALSKLQSIEWLFIGMVNSDGVVVLGCDGSILAYRAFLNPSEEERRSVNGEGGRRRTYSLMRSRLGGSLISVFYRSQDGATACDRCQYE